MTLTVLGEVKADQATTGRFFDASKQLAQAAQEAFGFTQAFSDEHERLFRKLGSRMLVRAALIDGGKLAPLRDYPENTSLKLVLDARKRRAQKYIWEISRFDPGIGTHINQLSVTPENIEAQQIGLDQRGNLKRHRVLRGCLPTLAMEEFITTALEPITHDYIEATVARLRSPLPTGDHTDAFPYQIG